jgi:hypothetical protein
MKYKLRPLPGLLVLATWLALGLAGVVSAATHTSSLAQGFQIDNSEGPVVTGALVSLKKNSTNVAQLATTSNSSALLGVADSRALITISQGAQEAEVVLNGTTTAFVSDINGTVHSGDKITPSPIAGVGMKATDAGQIVGTAQASLTSVKQSEQSITDKQGTTHTVKVGVVPVQVSVGYYAGLQDSGLLASVLPPAVLHLANGIAGQQVSPVRVLISLFALAFGFVIAANMLQSAARAGMISVGRNPLAKQALIRQLIDISLTALGVMILTGLVMYIVLRV